VPRIHGELRILVADDNRDSADSCKMLLELSGHTVRVAYEGPEAFDIAAEFQPDVVLLDIGMPQMNGFEVARGIRATAWGADAVLIAITGWGQADDKRRTLAAGFDHHLTKPIDIDTLAALLKERVNQPRA